ncbi:MAG TPA: di-heme oxidoredictase family protein [Burkholderiaceae bacterium]|nr:di-heme oxidoredictase family protein [Burkholderiaceae bacterium]
MKDPGPRNEAPASGEPLAGLNHDQLVAFDEGKAVFRKEFNVKDGLGPTMNLDNCEGCHTQPATGGTSGPFNPQVAFAAKRSATNAVPPFISSNGPARLAFFVKNADGSPDGILRNLFTIAGRADAPADCKLAQPDFNKEFKANNIATRISLPLFGDGLIEQVPDQVLIDNLASDAAAKAALGIRGKIANAGRLGRKAQFNAISNFSAGAFSFLLGLSNDFFPLEAASTAACQVAPVPNLVANFSAGSVGEGLSDNEKVATFIRFLAPPVRSADSPGGKASIDHGKQVFKDVGCALCHTPQLRTGNASIAVLANKDFNPYTDLLVHDMGTGLADGIQQGVVNGQEWRTMPLWGLGQRLFLLHDGRTTDLHEAILAHKSPGSESSAVVDKFNALPDKDAQDMLNFLRSL